MSGIRHAVLVIDDDPTILKVLTSLVSRAGYDVVSTTCTTEALQHAREQTFAVVISDQHMPGMSGADLLREIATIQEHASRILITGLRSLEVVASAVNRGGIFRLLTKPWVTAEFLAVLADAVHQYEKLESAQNLEVKTRELNRKLSEANEQMARQVRELELQKQELDTSRAALRTNFDHSLELCQRILGTFSPLLGARAKSTVQICENLAGPASFSAEEKHALIVSAHLYDIGLSGIPREYLGAVHGDPADLPLRIQHHVRNHTIYGQTLAAFVDDLKSVGDTIRWHHERFDGTGYPDAIAGEMIPWSARCLAVVAFYVSCGLPHDEAIESILAQSGAAFDPGAVRLFLRCSQAKPPPSHVREVLLHELNPGMHLATGIYSPTGMLLIPEGHRLDEAMIAKIRNHSSLTSLPQQLLVYC